MSPRYKWHVVLMLWWIAFFNYADRQAIFSVFPLLQKELHLTTFQLGLLGSSFAWVYGLCAPFAGGIVDRIRRKSAILGGLHTWSFICMATALSRNFTHLFAFRAAEGLGETFYFPASMSLVSDYHGKDTRSRALGIHQTSVYIGTIAGGYFAAEIGQNYGWRWSFVVFGGLGVLLGFVLNRFLIEPKRGASDEIEAVKLPASAALKMIWGTPTAVLLMAAFVCANFVAVVLLTWMPTFLYNEFHLSLATSGLTATLFVQLASMVGSPLGGWMADWLRSRTPGGRMIVQAIGVFGGAPFVVLCGATRSVSWLIVALIFWGLCKGLYDANIFASMFDVVRPEARGTAAGFMNMVGWLGGGGTAPVVIGWLGERYGLGYAISVAAAVYIAAGMLLLAAVMLQRKRASERVVQ
jgi:MFS family permease